MKRQRSRQKRFLYFLICTGSISVILVGVLVGVILQHPQAGAHASGSPDTGIQAMQPGVLPLRPMYKMMMKMPANGNMQQVPCLVSPQPPLCYTPQQFRQAYGVQQLLNIGITGQGRVIVIVDAFQDPTLQSELRIFDKLFGLQAPKLNILAPFGLTPFNSKDPAQTGFAGEIALDVEWAHVMAPDATIDLVLANVKNESIQGQITALLQATNFAVQHNIGSVISQSFGIGETCLPPALLQAAHKTFQLARAQHQTVLASAGDLGSGTIQCDAQGQPITIARGVNYPASDPLVTAVGGTTLFASRGGTYMRETAWNESQVGIGATGGGVSKIFPLPAFQQNIINSPTRAISDIALDADPLTGVPVVTSSLIPGQTLLVPIGGTSLGSPAIAGLVALFDQLAGKRLGFLNSALYRISQSQLYTQTFHDIKKGNNIFVFQDGNGNIVTVPGFNTGAGWDPPTGVGTPRAFALAAILPAFITPADGNTL